MTQLGIGKQAAGEFSAWLKIVRKALREDEEMKVPCGSCTACCTSSYFIHVAANETESLSRIPKELQFDAIGAHRGDVLLGFKEDGSCPMFENGGCRIYDYRPLTCRRFDCRILTATALLESDERPRINDQLAQWEFDFKDEMSRQQAQAVRTAASFLQKYRQLFPDGWVPVNPVQRSVLAIKVYRCFLAAQNENDFSVENMTTESINWFVNELMAEHDRFNGDRP